MKIVRAKPISFIVGAFLALCLLSIIRLMYQRESNSIQSNSIPVDGMSINKNLNENILIYDSVNFPNVDTTPLLPNAVDPNWFADMLYLDDMSMSACSNPNSEPYDVLILITTGLTNSEARMELRKSWANDKYLSNLTMTFKYGFLVGNPELGNDKAPDLAHSIRNESQTFNDIIAADFVDSYHNLTYKTMARLGWAVKHCPHFRYYISLDDDVCISLRNIQRFLKNPQNYTSSTALQNAEKRQLTSEMYAGYLAGGFPDRDVNSKYYVSYEEYPHDRHPDYILGWFVLMSRETVHSFYFMSKSVKYVSMEDVYLGMLANQTGILPLDLRYIVDGTFEMEVTNLERYKDQLAAHNMSPENAQRKMCEYLNSL